MHPYRRSRRRPPALVLVLGLLASILGPQAASAQATDDLYVYPDVLSTDYEPPQWMAVETIDGSEFGEDPTVRILDEGVPQAGAVEGVVVDDEYREYLSFDLVVQLDEGRYQVVVDDGEREYTGSFTVTEQLSVSVSPPTVRASDVAETTFTVTVGAADLEADAPQVRLYGPWGDMWDIEDVTVISSSQLTFTVPEGLPPGSYEVAVEVGDETGYAALEVLRDPSICEADAPLPEQVQGLTNVGFEDGFQGWSQGTVSDQVEIVGTEEFPNSPGGFGAPGQTSVSPYEGAAMLRLGSQGTNTGYGGSASQPLGPNEVCQDFVVTEETERFVFNVFTYDYTGYDEFRYDVTVQADDGQVIARYEQGAFGSGTDLKTTGWRGVELDLRGRTGETVRLTISAGGTSDDLYAFWAYIDSADDVEFPDPVPPTPIVGGNGSVMFDPNTGQTTIAFPVGTEDFGDLTLSYPVSCPGDDEVSSVYVRLDGTPYEAELNEAGTLATVVIPEEDVAAAAQAGATITIQIDCPSTQQVITLGRIVLYDPSGYLTDAETGEPIAGAEVLLWNVPGWTPKQSPDDDSPNTCQSHLSKGEEDPWDQPAPTELGVLEPAASERIHPNVNPFISNEVGYYGWDVAEGCWYVTVTADGYRPLTSPVVGVPPEVTDLDLQLTSGVDEAPPVWPAGASLTAVPGTTSVALSWPAASDESTPITYTVRRGETVVGTTQDTSFDVTGLAERTTYAFSVTPADAADPANVGTALTASATTLDGTPPAWPAGASLAAVPGTTSVALSWPAASDESTPITYTVRRGETVVGTTQDTSFDVTGLAERTTYAFSVTPADAADPANVGTALTASATTLDGTPPRGRLVRRWRRCRVRRRWRCRGLRLRIRPRRSPTWCGAVRVRRSRPPRGPRASRVCSRTRRTPSRCEPVTRPATSGPRSRPRHGPCRPRNRRW
jgi:hypothetical protein